MSLASRPLALLRREEDGMLSSRTLPLKEVSYGNRSNNHLQLYSIQQQQQVQHICAYNMQQRQHRHVRVDEYGYDTPVCRLAPRSPTKKVKHHQRYPPPKPPTTDATRT